VHHKRFYGWPLVGLGFIFYGLGIAPAYYSWGFFAPEIIDELGISRQDIGEVFGTLTLMLSLTSVLAAITIERWGLRATVTVGASIAALGWYLVGKADSLFDLYISYALIGGIGIGLSTLMPAQTLAVFWFRRFRARAIAIIFFGAAIFGAIVNPIDAIVLENGGWRTAWVYISAISIFVAVVAAVFLRNRPEDIGQQVDGESATEPDADSPAAAVKTSVANSPGDNFTLRQAITTPHFFIATFADIANAIPWRIITAHGRLHLETLGFAPTVAAAILGVRVGMSGVGRLSGSLSDFVRPTHVMTCALLMSAIGVGGLSFVTSANMAYACVALMGIGYGAAFTTIPVVFGDFFGRGAFVGTAGMRVAVTGIAGFFAVSWAGAVADKTGTYSVVLTALAFTCVAAAVLIYSCRTPRLKNGQR
jgi:sugar phosphate permease